MVAQALPSSPFQQGPPQLPTMRLNPVELMDAMRQIAPQPTEFAPRYPAGYKKPRRPTAGEVKQRADRLQQDHYAWLSLIEVTMAWLRHERVGMFPEDEEDRRNGLQEEWIDNALTAKNNIVISKVAASKMGVRKRYHSDTLRTKAQMIEDAAAWLQDELALQWVQKGNRPLKLDEALLFAQRGMYVSRQVFDVSDPDMPLNVDLIEPTQCFPVWGGKRGLQEVYRTYRDTIGNITAAYGDLTPDALKTLRTKYGRDITDQSEINIYEYWNTWDRVVLVDDQPIIPFTAHEYGYVPWTIQYGGYGDAMFTRTPGTRGRKTFGGTWEQVDRTTTNERAYRAVPLIYYDMRHHEMLEAIMGRIVTGFKREINPPIVRERSTMIAGTDVPEFSQAPGAVNEVRLGEERVSVTPSLTNNPITGMIVQTLQAQMNRTDPSINYNADKSNVTGAALSRMGDEGTEHILPIYQSLEMAKTHQFTQIFQTIGNWGHLTKYGSTTSVRPLMIPARKVKRQGESPAFELSRELIDEVGPKVEITFTKINPADWMGLFNAGKIGIEIDAMSPEMIYELATGDTDYDSFYEKLTEHKVTAAAMSHPKFNEIALIPRIFAEQIKEANGDPEMVKFWTDILADWQQMAAAPAQPGGGAPQGAPSGEGNPMAPGPQAPPMGAGQTLPAPMGPGNQGNPVGRPGIG